MKTIRALLAKFHRDETGSITPMFLVFVPILVIVVGLVIDGAGKIQANDNAQAIAAGATRSAANAVATQVISDGGVALDTNRARIAALDYIRAAGMTGTATVTAQRISVQVKTTYVTKFISMLGFATLPAGASASAEIITQ